MSKNKNISISQQKRQIRIMFGFIILLLATIGIFKISIGAIINVPIGYLFGDMFVLFFAFQMLIALGFILFHKSEKRLRIILVLLASFGLLLTSSLLYAGIINNFNLTSAQFNLNLQAMNLMAKESFTFKSTLGAYFYNYGGIIGEGLLFLLSFLGKGLIITTIVLAYIPFISIIFWPQITKLYKKISEGVRSFKKRRRVLIEAGLFKEVEEDPVPEQIGIRDVLGETTTISTSSILYRVGEQEKESIPTPITPAVEQTTKFEKPDFSLDFVEEPFSLPTLDTEDQIEAIGAKPIPINNPNNSEKLSFESLQKAVEVSEGTFESISFSDGEAVEDEEPFIPDFELEKEEIKPSETYISSKVINEREIIKEEPLLMPEVNITPEPLKPQSIAIEETVEKTEEKPKDPLAYQKSYKNFILPSIDLLEGGTEEDKDIRNRELALENSHIINEFFRDFKVGAEVEGWTIGSTFTRFEIRLEPTETVKSITNIIEDISRRLKGASVRFEPVIPGKSSSSLEVGNVDRTIVNFKDCMVEVLKNKNKKYLIPFGKDVAGKVIYGSFSDFPHMLVAGTTGSGKSVFVQTVLTSLIMGQTPDELRLLLIDPKRVELAPYSEIPHLMAPIIKDAKEACVALDLLIDEMERRYRLFEMTGVNKFSDYNEIAAENDGEQIPLIVAILDEFSDLVESEKEISNLVLRLVQKSRAAGIHLLLATQRPTVQTITGNIKANVTSRVAFMTSAAVDSVTIIGQGGAENLLGNGDMLLDSVTVNRGLLRVQAPYIPGKEVARVSNFLRKNNKTTYFSQFTNLHEKANPVNGFNGGVGNEFYRSALALAESLETISINKIQMELGVGWQRARQLYDMLEMNGIIETPDEANNAKGAIVVQNKRR